MRSIQPMLALVLASALLLVTGTPLAAQESGPATKPTPPETPVRLLGAAPAALVQESDGPTASAFLTLMIANELAPVGTGAEWSLAVGRLHRLGSRGWTVHPQLAAGLTGWRFASVGERLFGSARAAVARAWRQEMVELSPDFEVSPRVSVGAGLYRFRAARATQQRAKWVPVVTVGLGVRGLPTAERRRPHGVVSILELAIERRLAAGWERTRYYLRLGVGYGTPPGRLLPPRRPPDWWDADPPELPEGTDRSRRLARPDLPHHVYSYWGVDRVPGLRIRPNRLEYRPPSVNPADVPPFVDDPRADRPVQRSTLREAIAALQRTPDDPQLIYDLGAIFGVRGREAEALRAFDRALASVSDRSRTLRAVIHADAGVAFAALGLADSALARFERALESDPTYLSALLNRGVLLEELGREDDALAAYEQAVTRRSGAPAAWENLAFARIRAGDHARAVSALERALALRMPRADTRPTWQDERWGCADIALHREVTGEARRPAADCPAAGPLPSPPLLPPGS